MPIEPRSWTPGKPGQFVDLTAARFGQLLVLQFQEMRRKPSGTTHAFWRCVCDCGNEKIIGGDTLRQGKSQSCGHARRGQATEADLVMMRAAMPSAPDLFLLKIAYNPSGCWLWTADKTPNGYGRFSIDGKRYGAHAMAAVYSGQPVTFGDYRQMVRHICDNPPCCRLDHLVSGTAKENTADKIAKGRANFQFGEDAHMARLTVAAVRSIRASSDHVDVLAARHGVSRWTIYDVRSGRIWRHLLTPARG